MSRGGGGARRKKERLRGNKNKKVGERQVE